MQRVCQVPGGVKAYVESPGRLLSEETSRCPWCRQGHRLRRHGWYERTLLEAGAAEPRTIPVLRLLCRHTGCTLSLLPEFCLPRRQHSPGLLGLFLLALSKGRALHGALRSARPDAPGHSVAQSLRSGFLANTHRLHAYLARLRARSLDPPSDSAPRQAPLARLLQGLTSGFPHIPRAFEHHGRLFHARYGVGLA